MPKPLAVLLIIPIFFAACTQTNVTEDNSFQTYFDSAKVSGTFGLFDNEQSHFTIYNLPRFRDSAYPPAATFHILLSLVGIQTGIVKDDSAVIHWDPERLPLVIKPECDDDLTLQSAFQNSCGIAFRELARRIGKDTLRKWVDSLGYGNKNTSGPVDSFWSDNRLTITADEELGLVKKLYYSQLPFFQRTQQILCRMMLRESNANYRLGYVTGGGNKEDGHSIGWVAGWIEENKHDYFFVLNLESAGSYDDLAATGTQILRKILQQMGFFEGKK